ncbi:conserved hypothetical integral membrane protein [Streptococcus merionis]|uniref:Conserved hypothetical integral membrane protein n=2 Tax=Streptococcus merionis TaxID=400065 RepID=A0A239SSG8_9STRE|nr:conserved hypothetical integral membrane protein [Streptococcus merionis]
MNMLKKIFDGFYSLSYHLVFGLTLFILLGFSWIVVNVRALMKMNLVENTLYFPITSVVWIGLLLFIIFLYLLRLFLPRLSEKHIFIMWTILYVVAGFYLIFNVSSVIRSDAKHVLTAAKAMNLGDYSSLTVVGSYLYKNPHQLGLVTFDRVISWVGLGRTEVFFILYLLITIGINYFQWKITALLFHNTLINKLTLFLSFLFLPLFFFILFVYGSHPGLLCMLMGLYFLLKYENTHKKSQLTVALPALTIGYLIRTNYIIFVLALIAIYLLLFWQDHKIKRLGTIGLICLSLFMGKTGLHTYYQLASGQAIPKGTPMIAYVTMGLRDVSPTRGHWDAYNTKLLDDNQNNQDKAKKQAISDLKVRLKTFRNDPTYALEFFTEKVTGTWAEPTFQSIWSGPQKNRNQEVRTHLLKSIYQQGLAYRLINIFLFIYLMIIYLLSSLYLLYKGLVKCEKFPSFALYPYIFLIGGFLFHLFWETKSQYVYIYVYLLIPTLAQAIASLPPISLKSSKQRL